MSFKRSNLRTERAVERGEKFRELNAQGPAVTDYQVRRWARATIRDLERHGWCINRAEAYPHGVAR